MNALPEGAVGTRAARRGAASIAVTGATLLAAASMLVFGLWAFFAPESFIDYVNYRPYNEHLTHDAGAFQVGIGVGLVAALVWPGDALLAALTGFVVASGLHTVSHYTDRHLGGHGSDVPLLGLLTVIAFAALLARLRTGRT